MSRSSPTTVHLGASVLARALLAGAILVLAGCGGNLVDQPDYTLGVPYHAQESFNYCVPACIQMWMDYDALPVESRPPDLPLFRNVRLSPG